MNCVRVLPGNHWSVTDYDKVFPTYDALEQDTYIHVLSKDVTDIIRDFETDWSENLSSSNKSNYSSYSRKSKEQIEAATEAVALKVKLDLIDIEAKNHMELVQKWLEPEKI